MKNMIKNLLIALFFLSLTACSYSPNAFKEVYNKLESDISEELKQPMDLSLSQAAKVDAYASKVMKWHRKTKLPEYSQSFLKLASYVQQEDIPLTELQTVLKELEAMPVIVPAHHLTPMLVNMALTLNESQISQLEQALKDEYQRAKYEMKTEKYANDISNEMNYLFAFMGVNLDAKQEKIVKAESKKFYDLRWFEIQEQKKWNERLITLLRRSKSPQFRQEFTQLWDSQGAKYKGKVLAQKRQNEQREARLIKALVSKFGVEKRNKLVSQLTSISNTLSEMANQ